MKKVVLASLVACAALVLPYGFAQNAEAPAAAAPAAGGQAQMPAAEAAVYNNAVTMPQDTPANIQAKAAALEAYLTQYPQSIEKATALGAIMQLDATYDGAKALNAADRLLQVDPTNVTALYIEAVLHKPAASVTDPIAIQAALDTAADYAKKALAATKPAAMSDADWTKMQGAFYPNLYSVIGGAAWNKQDMATAIDNYKKELASVPVAQTQDPNQSQLPDTYQLAWAYWKSTPPDYLDCAFYGARFAAFAPEPFKTQGTKLAKYCYHTYHGDKDDQYDQLVQLASASLNPPAALATSITPKPTPPEIIAGILKDTPVDQLATSDKEYILQNGTPDQVQQVWGSMKGKSYEFPDLLVVASTPQQLQVAVSEDSKQNKVADFTFAMTPPEMPEEPKANATPAVKAAYKKKLAAAQKEADAIAAATAVGQTVTLSGTFDSFTPSPFMINLTDGAVILPTAAPAAKTPAKTPAHTTARPKAAAH